MQMQKCLILDLNPAKSIKLALILSVNIVF